MVRPLIEIKRYILNIVIDEGILSKQYVDSLIVEKEEDIFECFINHPEFQNELVIESLIDNYNYPSIKQQTLGIKIQDYSKINEYFKYGYFVFHDNAGKLCFAINNISMLTSVKIDLKENFKIFLVKKKDLYEILEANFSSLNTAKAQHHLENISDSETAKNIDYKKRIVGFIVIFTSFLCFFY